MELDGKVAVVTGGTRGVGAGIARSFARAGAEVVVVARRPPEVPLPRTEFTALDVRDADAVREFFAGLPRCDVLVNNAGGAPYRRLADAPAERHARVIELNLLAPLTVSLAAHEHLRRARGAVVMIGSVSGSRPSPGSAAYGAAKAGLEHLARSMAVEWAPQVRVNTLVVGMVHTELAHLHYGGPEGVEGVSRTIPLGRLAQPADVGAAAVFLASDAAAYISGASLLVHGGGERPAFLDAATANKDAATANKDAATVDKGAATADKGAATADKDAATADKDAATADKDSEEA